MKKFDGESLLLSIAMTSMINTYFFLEMSCFFLIGTAMIWVAVWGILNEYPKQKAFLLFIAGLSSMSIMMSAIWKVNLIAQIQEIYSWIIHYDYTEVTYVRHDALVLMAVVTAGVSLITYVLRKKVYVKGICILTALGIVIALSTLSIKIDKITMVALVACLLISAIECQEAKAHGEQIEQTMKYFIPLCLAGAIITSIIPSNEQPVKWQLFKKVYSDMQELAEKISFEFSYGRGGRSDEFHLDFLSYDEENSLGGDLNSQEDEMLRIRIQNKTHTPLYLAGSYKDSYTGKSWEATRESQEAKFAEYQLDTCEILAALVSDERLRLDEDFINMNRLEIAYKNMQTRTFFVTPKLLQFQQSGKQNRLTKTRAGILFEKRQGEGTNYTENFLEYNPVSEALQQRLRKLDDFSYASQKEILSMKRIKEQLQAISKGIATNRFKDVEDLNSLLAERSQMINRVYTSLPEEIPDSIRKLTEEITSSQHNRYDKLKAIESYLHTYTYTTFPGKVPEDRDFVEYFLLESKQGYCSYFAAAMAVMARSIGIPMRYVEGFIIDYEKAEGMTSTYIVRGKKAHAWTEAYFEGFGWVIFEPSAGYEISAYENDNKEITGITEISDEIEETETVDESYMENLQHILQEEKIKDRAEKEKKVRNISAWIGEVSALLVLIILGGKITACYLYQKKYRRADGRTQFKMEFLEMMKLLEKEGYQLKQEETLEQFRKIIIEHRQKDCNEEISHMIRVYESIKYGNKGLSEEERASLKEDYQRFLRGEEKAWGKLRLSYYRMMLMKK